MASNFCGNHRTFLDPPLMEVTTGRYTRFLAKEELTKNNFSIFTFQKPFERITEIKNLIKSNNKDQIEWIEIEKNGVFHNVSIIERKKEQLENDIAKHDLVASKNGIIKDMYITSGEILKNKGDYVAKGEVIVSSKIKKGDEKQQ